MMSKNIADYIGYTTVIPRQAWDLFQKARPNDAIYDFLVEFLSPWSIPEIAIPAYPDPFAGMEVSIEQDGVSLKGYLLRKHLNANYVAAANTLVFASNSEWLPVLSLKRQIKLN